MTAKKTNVTLVTIAIFVATFLTAVEGTIVSTAMPTIVGDLHGVNLMNWIVSIYLLTNAVATPIYGKLADLFGRKRIFMIGIMIFIVGSGLSGTANSMQTLIGWRALQGIGAGCIMPVANTIIADIYPFEKRARVMGFNGAAWGIAAIIAPLLGGFIVDQLTWHWVFFINIPIGLLTVILIALYLHEEPHTAVGKIDYLGSLWLTLTLLSLMYGFQVLGEANFAWQTVIICFAITIVALILFINREKRAPDPIISLKLFKNRTFVTQNLATMLVSGFLIGFEVYLPTWTQGILGLPASLAGFAVTPSSIMWIFGSFLAGKFILKLTPKQTLMISLGFLLVGSAWLALLPQTTPFWLFFVIATILGIGFGITITSTTVTSQRLVAAKDMGVATSFNTLARTLGQTLMMSIFGIIMNGTMNRGVAQNPQLNIGMMNKLINPQTASSLPAKLIPVLRTILYQALHNIYIAGVILILLAIFVNSLDYSHPKKVH
ncbi:Permease of the major facilitator superfamily [Pediococcus damnosus]|uniref:Permease of the major facilitator superfamily n=1 Tax=Pediococcus damnosus TaxID=51663 RepID=A0ABM6A5W5_9LACO|nr:MDR family MFS transporter [Pediococcus damnosus]AMV61300.1 Permeases of the major facilitator superfamily [Pediococcus damnosus]AMV65660.1 Permease of the major facilitator superfamily [Pediococcus damnosus]AMV67795.1 Permease of the major facilitator superfamily [Pediococcus damnosus]KJU74074.1 multidrug MFS transporter [Pediococcus damnosus LMG 28219]PIO84755.1 MFS transporter [Pediococcus damnosus]